MNPRTYKALKTVYEFANAKRFSLSPQMNTQIYREMMVLDGEFGLEPSHCESPDTPEANACIREEQCDDCALKDHLKECEGCDNFDHPIK